jgi:hypothetical protein
VTRRRLLSTSRSLKVLLVLTLSCTELLKMSVRHSKVSSDLSVFSTLYFIRCSATRRRPPSTSRSLKVLLVLVLSCTALLKMSVWHSKVNTDLTIFSTFSSIRCSATGPNFCFLANMRLFKRFYIGIRARFSESSSLGSYPKYSSSLPMILKILACLFYKESLVLL